jgi:putative cell wall-binding protein
LITRTSRGTKRFMATAAAVAMIGSTLAISSAALAVINPVTPAATTFRVFGENRNATAVDAAKLITGQNKLTIVNGRDFPDGLAAAGLGAHPILLTTADAIPADTLAYLKFLAANGDFRDITIVGGTSVVSDAVAGQLNGLNGTGTINRVFGADRYATALAVGTANISANGGSNAILATGLSAADALSAFPLARSSGDSIILNDGDSLRADVRAWFVTNGITDVKIIGGTSAVPQSVEDELTNELGITVTRLEGATRDATAAKIANYLHAKLFGGIDNVVLVNRTGFADALAAGPLTEKLRGAILTVGVNSLPAATAAFLAANCGAILKVTAIGGTSVISAEVLAAAAAATKCTVPGISSAALTITKTTQRVMYIGDTALAMTNIARDTTAPTLTSIAGSAASGVAANNYAISFVDAVGAPSVTVTPGAPGTPTVILYTDNFTGVVTRAQFVATWNASAAKDLFVAAVGSGTSNFTAVPEDDAQSAGGSTVPGEVVGSYDATLVVTFDQAVYGVATNTAPVGVVNNNSSTVTANTAVLLAGGSTVTPAAVVPTAGVTTVTQTWTGQTTAVPTANATVRYEVAANGPATVSNLANGQGNVAVLMKTITVS